MGQRANSNRGASLDDSKERAAGRRGQNGPEAGAIKDAVSGDEGAPMKGKTGGASGKDGQANRTSGGPPASSGGGGANPTNSGIPDVGRSTRPAKKR